jgi:phosphomannomutase
MLLISDGPDPAFYYALKTLGVSGGHNGQPLRTNPPEYNGFKLMFGDLP